MKKLILSIICLIGFSTAHAIQFQSFNFNDESDCAEQLGQLPVSLPRGVIDPNYLSKSKEICLQAYTGDNACRKEYRRQKDALGLISGVSSNYTAKQQTQAKAQCGTWLKNRRSACEDFLQKASAVCYQLKCVVEDSDIGDSYSGDCQNGKAHGFGVAKGRDTYRGNFIDGKTHGHGVYTWDSGRYEGNWVNGKRTGHGVYTWDSGSRYEGNFNGKRTGHGVQTWANGSRYEGNWVNGKRTGHGVYTWDSGSRYEGNFNGKRTGHGVQTWANGSRYEGNWVNGKRTGHGVFTWANGDRYEGSLVNGQKTGQGTYYYSSGNTKTGYWVNGECLNC